MTSWVARGAVGKSSQQARTPAPALAVECNPHKVAPEELFSSFESLKRRGLST